MFYTTYQGLGVKVKGFEAFADPPVNQSNLRYPLAAMLLAGLVAGLCNNLSELAIAQCLADQPLAIKLAKGFKKFSYEELLLALL